MTPPPQERPKCVACMGRGWIPQAITREVSRPTLCQYCYGSGYAGTGTVEGDDGE